MTDKPLVTVFGSLHYDIMVDSPDRPRKGETLAGSAWFPKCGGKGGNQAVAAARAGVPAAMIGAVGDDDFGRALIANLDRRGVDRGHVRVLDSAGSGMSVAIFDADGDYGAVIVDEVSMLDIFLFNDLLKAVPEGSRPTCVQRLSPRRPRAMVSRKTLEMLWIENGASASPAACTAPSRVTTARPKRPGSTWASCGM